MGVYTRWNTPSSTPVCGRATFLEGRQFTPMGGGKRCTPGGTPSSTLHAGSPFSKADNSHQWGRQEMYSRWNTIFKAFMQSRLSRGETTHTNGGEGGKRSTPVGAPSSKPACRAAFLERGKLTSMEMETRDGRLLQVEPSSATPECRAAFAKGTNSYLSCILSSKGDSPA